MYYNRDSSWCPYCAWIVFKPGSNPDQHRVLKIMFNLILMHGHSSTHIQTKQKGKLGKKTAC